MANPAGAKGREKENAVAGVYRAAGFPEAKRKRQTGALDEGDLGGIPDLTVEVKYAGPGKPLNLGVAVDEAVAEARNAGTSHYVAAVHRARKSAADTYAVRRLEDDARLYRELVTLRETAESTHYLLAAARRAERELSDASMLELAYAIRLATSKLEEITPPEEQA